VTLGAGHKDLRIVGCTGQRALSSCGKTEGVSTWGKGTGSSRPCPLHWVLFSEASSPDSAQGSPRAFGERSPGICNQRLCCPFQKPITPHSGQNQGRLGTGNPEALGLGCLVYREDWARTAVPNPVHTLQSLLVIL